MASRHRVIKEKRKKIYLEEWKPYFLPFGNLIYINESFSPLCLHRLCVGLTLSPLQKQGKGHTPNNKQNVPSFSASAFFLLGLLR